jgi:hypothetical protein
MGSSLLFNPKVSSVYAAAAAAAAVDQLRKVDLENNGMNVDLCRH